MKQTSQFNSIDNQADYPRPRVLLVDDEPRVLEGLTAHLGRRYEIVAISESREAIRRLETDDPYHVLVTDMRMPVMDGVDVLRESLRITPDTVRILLTGYADIETAAQAINEGRIFRFLTKPCAPPLVNRALHDAVVHYRQQTKDRRLVASEVQQICSHLIETDRLASIGVLAGGLGSELVNLSTVALATYSSLEQTLAGADPDIDEQLEDIRWVGRQLRDHSRTLSRMVTESAAGPQRFDLAELAQRTIDDLNVFGPLRTARLTIDICDGSIWVEGEKTRLRQALINLLLRSANAVDRESCNDAHITVAVSTDPDENRAIVRIQDNGTHPDSGEVSDLPNWLMSEKSSGKGMLSLSAVQLIVEEHSGELRLDDSVDERTEVRLLLPLAGMEWSAPTRVDLESTLATESTWGEIENL
jgi:CheY-like chemotaxis protein